MFDRFGLYNSESFDIHDQSKKFIRVFMNYILMDDDEFDLNNFIQHNNQDNFIIIREDTIKKNIKI